MAHQLVRSKRRHALYFFVLLTAMPALLAYPLDATISLLSNQSIACPCDAEPTTELAENGDSCNEADADHSEEKCPDNCPDCSCCMGITAGVVPNLTPRPTVSGAVTEWISQNESPSNQDPTDVFRPPRILLTNVPL